MQGRTGQDRAEQSRVERGRAGWCRTGQGMVGKGRVGQDTAGQGRTRQRKDATKSSWEFFLTTLLTYLVLLLILHREGPYLICGTMDIIREIHS